MKILWLLGTILASMLALLSGGPAFGQEPTRNTLHDAATGKLKAAELPVTFNLLPVNGVAHDEDVFTTRHSVPNGFGKPGTGKIGRD